MGKLCVLVVEDEGVVAMLIEDMLLDLGHEIGAIAARVDEAAKIAATGSFDVAVLDVNLGGALSYPVAEILNNRNIPFVFATGYGAKGLDPKYAQYWALQKPFMQADLSAALSRAMAHLRAGG